MRLFLIIYLAVGALAACGFYKASLDERQTKFSFSSPNNDIMMAFVVMILWFPMLLAGHANKPR